MHTKKHGKYLSRACHSTMLRCTAAILDPVRVIWSYHNAESSHTVVSWFTKARMKVRAVRSLSLRGKKNKESRQLYPKDNKISARGANSCRGKASAEEVRQMLVGTKKL